MSTLETILSRAMSDPAFADALFADPEKALAEYDLSAEEIAIFKNITRAEFESLEAEARQSMSALFAGKKKGTNPVKYMEVKLNNLNIS